jgi:hypothetical protein
MTVHTERFVLRIVLTAADFAECLTALLLRFVGRRGSTVPRKRLPEWPEPCGRHGRLFGWRGGRETYDHVIRELDVPVAGVHFEVVEWCDIPEAEAPPGAR